MTDAESVQKPVFEFFNINKVFPGVRALDDVSLEVYPGEVLALVGENGAGKSTLLKVMNGDYEPDGGSLKFRGETVSFQSPAEAHALGVRVIYQEPEILPDLTVAENIYMGNLPTRFGSWVDWNKTFEMAQADLERLGVGDNISSEMKAGTLSAAQRQMLEIVRAVRTNASILALDEPTSSLSEADSARLFDIVEQFRQEGVGIIYVSHRLPEVLQLADRIAVLRDGELVAVRKRDETDESDLVSLMVGRELSELFEQRATVLDEVALKVEGLTTYRINNVSFEVRKEKWWGLPGWSGRVAPTLPKL